MANSTPDEKLIAAIRVEAMHELDTAAQIIRHCLDQLDDEQIWWRADETMNSIGNLILHVCGNVGQWIVVGFSGAPDDRRRQEEFDRRDPLASDILWQRVTSTLAAARAALATATTADMLGDRTIQGFAVNGLRAVFHSVSHFRGHTQEIVHLTRQQLGAQYRFDFVAKTAAEGAPAEGAPAEGAPES